MKSWKATILLAVLLILSASAVAQQGGPLLLQSPALSRTHVVFVFADDLWIVDRAGGDARRLTTGPGLEQIPFFSPDGSRIAFTGNYDGNTDVYVIAAAGGVPERLTYHPGTDRVRGWTPDGTSVLFASNRNSYSGRFTRLFTISLNGGLPEQLPLPIALTGSFSPDGKKIAYDPLGGAYQTWKRYRGGRASFLWIADLSDSSAEKLPREDWNDFNPMWVGDKVYFLSDREGYVTLYSYDTGSKQVKREIRHRGFDIKSASAGPGAIVYEQFGSLHLYDLASSRTQPLTVRVAGDLASVRPRFVNVSRRLTNADLSPTGKRAVFEGRGEILTVPADKGDIRNLTNTSGTAERDPAWSPDGKWIAFFSDESGEYALHLKEQTGQGEIKKITLGTSPGFYYSPVWSPDSKKIVYLDAGVNLWYVDIEQGRPVKVDHGPYYNPFRTFDPEWSPDSRWITYTKQLKSHLHAVFIFDTQEGRTHPVTDGLSDARYAAFDKNGKHLYFTASTDVGPTTAWLDMASFGRTSNRSVYLVVLGKEETSPLAPESDEETVKEEEKEGEEENKEENQKPDTPEKDAADKGKDKDKDKKEVKVEIDFENIGQRILALPVPARNYAGLLAGKAGTIFLAAVPGAGAGPGPPAATVYKFEMKERKATKFTEGIRTLVLSSNGEKALIRRGQNWAIVGTQKPPKAGDGKIKTADVRVKVDPRAEWRQMYREVWRIERDFLYDPNAHGLDLQAAEKRYAPFLDGLGSRTDLNYLISEMLGNLVLGHTRNGGGDTPSVERVPGGLLGADYSIENGRYRFARIYHGENWNPQLRAPLTEPGVNVNEGDYLLAVNGREVSGADNVFSFFENTSGKQVVLRVAASPDGAEPREVTVVPVSSEVTLRNRAWMDANRRKVAELSGGRVGYLYLPNTAGAGYTNFNRYYFAQAGSEGVVVDERFNGGGTAANYIVDVMNRKLANYWTTRWGDVMTTPAAAVFGPKVMIINEFAGSGGDWMPWYFRFTGAGKLVGKRTWGGLVGTLGFPALIDGGGVTAPNVSFWNQQSEWLIENVGVPPDIEVELDPKAWREGRDPQLEKAVEVVLEELRKNPLPTHKRPAFPNYYKGRRQP